VSESADPDDAARLEDGALHLLGKVRVTCQRCRRPFDHIYHAPPRSLGLLPIGREAEGEFLVPLADDEAFWLGLKSPVASVSVVLFAETKNWAASTSARDGQRRRTTVLHLSSLPTAPSRGFFVTRRAGGRSSAAQQRGHRSASGSFS
jgi:hypothetical protein